MGAECEWHMLKKGECDEGLICYKNMCVHEQQQREYDEKKCLEVRDMTRDIAKDLYDGKVWLDGFSKPYEMSDYMWDDIKKYPHCDYRKKKEKAKEPPGYDKVFADRENEEKR